MPDDPACHYNIGAAYTNKHDPTLAIKAFEKVIELDPTGEYGIGAAKNLEKLKAGTVGKKGFTGSWIIVVVLGVFAFGSLILIAQQPAPGILNLILWGGILILYWKKKFK
jgi:tetratricopeptide repeat protein